MPVVSLGNQIISSSGTNKTLYIQDIYSIFIILFASVGAVLHLRILYCYVCRRKSSMEVNNLSKCMMIYILFNAVGMPIIDLWRISYLFYSANTFGLLNLGSIIPNNPVNPTVTNIYEWLNRVYLVFMGMLPSSVFFLTFERCIGVQFPTKFTRKLRNRMAVFDIVCSPVVSTAIYVFAPRFIWPYKMTVGILNTCACSFLIWKVKGRKKTPGIIIAKNTSLMELCLEFLPNLILFLVLTLELTNINMYISSLPIVGQCLNAVTCGILCNVRYSAKKNKVTPVTVSMSVKLNYPSEIRKADAIQNQKF